MVDPVFAKQIFIVLVTADGEHNANDTIDIAIDVAARFEEKLCALNTLSTSPASSE